MARSPGVPQVPFFRDPKLRAIIYQVVLCVVLAALACAAVRNAAENLARANIASGFGFWNTIAGFDISQTLIEYSAQSSTYGRAFWVGLTNTLLVAGLGIILATLLGTFIGVARMSKNFLVERLASGYVEIIRNVPLLLQLLFWYNAVLKALPDFANGFKFPGGFLLNNRGLYVPRPQGIDGWHVTGVIVLAVVLAYAFNALAARSAGRLRMLGLRFVVTLLIVVGIPVLALIAMGAPVAFEYPEAGRFNVRGGVEILPEFVALLVGLVIYTAAFIAEVVRAGLMSVSRGQTEAAQALGLGPLQTLRYITMPQAMRVIIPPLTNQYLNLTKNSSLAVAIGYPDLVQIFTGTVLNITGQAIEVVVITMAVYLTFSLVTSFTMNLYNARVALVGAMTVLDTALTVPPAGPGPRAYVRAAPAEALAPPRLYVGWLGWAREHLFANPLSTVLTILIAAALVLVVPPLVDFLFIDATWSGTDREACLATPARPEAGACWAFIRERFAYTIYGSYPIAERWRVDVFFALLAFGTAWLLWLDAPRRDLGSAYFFIMLPIVSFILLHGAPALGLPVVDTALWGGMLVTIVVAAVGIVASLPIGVMLALGRRSQMPAIRLLSTIYIEFVRGVPLITVLFMASVMLPLFLPETWSPDKLIRALVGVALFASAYMAEVVRAGLQSIPKGQYDASHALGLSYWQSLRHIILPQALKVTIPNIVNSYIALFKDTTLVFFVGIFDFLKTIEVARADPKWSTPVTSATGYIYAAVVFFVFCYAMSRYAARIEKRLAVSERR